MDSLDSREVQKALGLEFNALDAELKSLDANAYIVLQPNKINKWVLTPEGLDYAKNGTPEAKLHSLSSAEGTPVKKVQEALKDYKIALGNAMKKKLVTLKD